ncbi:MAG: dihydrofolate reductase family protein, partial [archaeon]
MRKLKLQMQVTLDGHVAGPNGELDWMTWNWSEDLKDYAGQLTRSFDTILLGRKMTDGFVNHWENVTKDPNNPEYEAARIFVDTPKVVFTTTLTHSKWKNTVLAKGSIVEEVNRLKQQKGKDMIVYGGAGFVSSLVQHHLIDEYYLFVNPVVIGKGMRIFDSLHHSY